MAARSPPLAISIALRPIASASSAIRLSISSVARLRDPNGRPAGFPHSPFSYGMAYFPFCLPMKIRRCGAASCARAAKSPARFPVRAAGVASVNMLFWKILVTRVKRFF
jgi:hypothetical protein